MPRATADAPGQGIVAIDRGQRFEEVAAWFGEAIVHVDEPPPGMGQAVRQDRLELARQVAQERASHIWIGGGNDWGEVLENLRQVLARMPTAAEKQRYAMAVEQCDHA